MLNEGYQMLMALRSADIEPEKKHPKIDKVPRTTGPCLHVRFNAEGHIVDVSPVLEESLPQFWKFSLDNTYTFPVIRMREPLMERGVKDETAEDTEGKDKSPSVGERLRRDLEKATLRPVGDEKAKYFKGLYREKGEIRTMEAALRNAPDGVRLEEVIRRFQKAFPCKNGIVDRDTVQATLGELCEKAKTYLEHNRVDESTQSALTLLFFDAASGGGKTVQLAFDTDHDEKTIYSSAVRKQTIAILLEAETESKAGNSKQRRGTCALTGKDAALHSQTFPKVRLPELNEKGLPLFSMNSTAAECNTRYHRKDSELYPIVSQTVLDIQDAYNYLLHDDRKGETWQTIPGDNPGSHDLLIAYVNSDPKFAGNLAAFFDNADDSEEEFLNETAKICESLQLLPRTNPDVRISLTVIRNASEGQGFVLFSVLPSPEEIVSGATWWRDAMTNVPYIRIPVFKSGAKGVVYRAGPLPIKPGNIVALLTEAWTEARGTAPDKGRTNKLRGESFAVALSLMIGHPYLREDAARRLLSTTLKHTGPLLLRIGACQWRGDFSPFQDADRKKALRAISVIGLILTALRQPDESKERYMQEPAFLIGRFLALADRLHYDYCMVVREEQIPPGLIGNAVMATALKNPTKAFELLAQRMVPYIGWAKTTDVEKNKHSRFAKAVLREYQTVADALASQKLPDRCTDEQKAQMLLGYLASTKSPSDKDDSVDAAQGQGASQPQKEEN